MFVAPGQVHVGAHLRVLPAGQLLSKPSKIREVEELIAVVRPGDALRKDEEIFCKERGRHVLGENRGRLMRREAGPARFENGLRPPNIFCSTSEKGMNPSDGVS